MVDGKKYYEQYMANEHVTQAWSLTARSILVSKDARELANVIMHFSSLTNGQVNFEAWGIEEHHTGMPRSIRRPSSLLRAIFGDEIKINEHWHGLADGAARQVLQGCEDYL